MGSSLSLCLMGSSLSLCLWGFSCLSVYGIVCGIFTVSLWRSSLSLCLWGSSLSPCGDLPVCLGHYTGELHCLLVGISTVSLFVGIFTVSLFGGIALSHCCTLRAVDDYAKAVCRSPVKAFLSSCRQVYNAILSRSAEVRSWRGDDVCWRLISKLHVTACLVFHCEHIVLTPEPHTGKGKRR